MIPTGIGKSKIAFGFIQATGAGAGMLAFGPLSARWGIKRTFVLMHVVALALTPVVCWAPWLLQQLRIAAGVIAGVRIFRAEHSRRLRRVFPDPLSHPSARDGLRLLLQYRPHPCQPRAHLALGLDEVHVQPADGDHVSSADSSCSA